MDESSLCFCQVNFGSQQYHSLHPQESKKINDKKIRHAKFGLLTPVLWKNTH
ncbi:MAG: hypothetical protein J0H93_06715 [Chlamydiales bacterium]|nr:hypothetical protein [Chlamydiales bacterium]